MTHCLTDKQRLRCNYWRQTRKSASWQKCQHSSSLRHLATHWLRWKRQALVNTLADSVKEKKFEALFNKLALRLGIDASRRIQRENCRGGGSRKVTLQCLVDKRDKRRDNWRYTRKMMPEALCDLMARTSKEPDALVTYWPR